MCISNTLGVLAACEVIKVVSVCVCPVDHWADGVYRFYTACEIPGLLPASCEELYLYIDLRRRWQSPDQVNYGELATVLQ